MTMLTHTRGPFTPASIPRNGEARPSAGTANAHLATIKRFCVCALALLAGGAVAGIIALRTAAYFWRFHY